MKRAIAQLYALLNKKERLVLFSLFLMMFIGSLLEIIGIGAIPAFLAVLINPNHPNAYSIINDIINYLNLNDEKEIMIWGSILLIFIYLIKNLFLALLYYIKSRFLFKFKKRLEISLYKKYIYAPFIFHLKTNSSDLIRNVTQEISHIVVNVLLPLLQIILDSFLFILILSVLVAANPFITMTVGIVLGMVSLLFASSIKSNLKKYGKIALDHRTLMIKHLNQGLGAIKELKIIRNEDYFVNKFSHSAEKTANAAQFRQITSLLPKPFLEIMMVAGLLSIILILYNQGEPTEVIIPMITLYGVALLRLLPIIGNIITNYTSIRYNYVSIAPVFDHLINIPHVKRNNLTTPIQTHQDQKIIISNLSFRYPETDKTVVDDVSFKITKGQVIGFVGYTGSGKTTIVDILIGLLPTDRKSISYNTNKFESISDIFNGKVGYIPQNIFLIDDSIRNNIALGVEEKNIEEIKINNAISMAQLTDLTKELENGVNTIIGERGIRLSGGQRQRIGIARALYFEPEILIMDEATSSLDNQTEKFFIDAIQNLRNKMTIIIIAHRLTTIEHCDHIYFMKEGKIIAEGNYNILLQNCSEFRELAGQLS